MTVLRASGAGGLRGRDLGSRTVAAYCVLYVGLTLGLFDGVFLRLVPWFGRVLLELDVSIPGSSNGSGDTLFHWIEFLLTLLAAPFVAMVWTALDRQGRYDLPAREGLRVLLRYTLAFFLMMYGAGKLSQFPPLSLGRLIQRFGDFSPMGVLWTFMSASPAYSLFAGFGEISGALLLLFRKTATLGALVSAGVMANVVMLNFAYDVPVKIFSSHLLLFAILVAAPDARRLANLLVFNRTAEPARIDRAWPRAWMGKAAMAGKSLFIVALVGWGASLLWQGIHSRIQPPPKPSLFGIWEVDTFTSEGQVLPPLKTETSRWQSMTLSARSVLGLRRMEGPPVYFFVRIDDAERSFTVSAFGAGDEISETPAATLRFARPSDDRLEIDGVFEGRAITASFHRLDEKKFLVIDRGFHWINEFPFNR